MVLGAGGLLAVAYGVAATVYTCHGFGPCEPPASAVYGYAAVAAGVAGIVLSAVVLAYLRLRGIKNEGR
jgi:hypothetical protein